MGGLPVTGSRVLKWVTGSMEAVLAIPFIGALIVIGSFYTVLVVMLILHIVTLVLSISNKEPYYGSIVGIVTSVIAWIPFVGWLMHLISTILLMITASQRPAPPRHGTYHSY